MLLECFRLFYTFVKLGFLSFGGGYAMLPMVISEAQSFSISAAQIADLYALDMVVPGPISINAATYAGYLHQGLLGAVAATLGVSLPSFIMTVVLMRLFAHYKDDDWLTDILSGIKPATVGLIAAAAVAIASEVLTNPGKNIGDVFANPIGALSLACVAIFVLAAALNIRFKTNPILLTVLAGIAGAIVMA
ncbi:MAG: chromate transporter [Christensenellaceae bacterium]|nr:chromate transporter [Christensenellaceae bacterium]